MTLDNGLPGPKLFSRRLCSDFEQSPARHHARLTPDLLAAPDLNPDMLYFSRWQDRILWEASEKEKIAFTFHNKYGNRNYAVGGVIYEDPQDIHTIRRIGQLYSKAKSIFSCNRFAKDSGFFLSYGI